MNLFVAYRFYGLGLALSPFREWRRLGVGIATGNPEARTLSEASAMILFAKTRMLNFQSEEDVQYFPGSIAKAGEVVKLLEAFTDVTNRAFSEGADYQNVLSNHWVVHVIRSIVESVDKFEVMLNHELNMLPVFCIDENKGNLSLQQLIKGASAGLPANVKSSVTAQILEEYDEAGRCLAFNRATASAFHSLRSLELTVQRKIVNSSLVLPPLNRCNWGEYIQVLKNGNASKEIVDLLQIIKDNYRNPIMHPDQVLDMPSAISLFNISHSALEVLCR